ncbi:MAG: hypothetical protein IPF71_16140 [Rhodoferax sp.]|nr:hypothetical protein [Rhodoferax sp.]
MEAPAFRPPPRSSEAAKGCCRQSRQTAGFNTSGICEMPLSKQSQFTRHSRIGLCKCATSNSQAAIATRVFFICEFLKVNEWVLTQQFQQLGGTACEQNTILFNQTVKTLANESEGKP